MIELGLKMPNQSDRLDRSGDGVLQDWPNKEEETLSTEFVRHRTSITIPCPLILASDSICPC